RDMVDGSARERIWYAMARAGIPGGLPNRNVLLTDVSSEARARADLKEAERREKALAVVDFFRMLSDDQRRRLAEASKVHLYGTGEPVVRQGEASSQMFIVQSGEVVVQSEGNGAGTIELARLQEGEFFGEMALMTGEQRTATVRAAKPSTLISIDQS